MEAMIPPSALEMFASEAGDRVYYRIDDTAADRSGRLIAGSPDLPVPPEPPDDLSPRYFDAEFRGQLLHLVAIRQPVTGDPPRAAVIVVGETTGARSQMVADLWIQGFLQQGLLVLIVGILAWFGLQRGLRPLLRLRDEVVERRPDDLRPLTATALQHELQPLATALNQYMGRVKSWSAVQRRFIANAAHQLRTPLTLLSTQATYALRTTSAAEKDEALQAIHANMQQMTRLANQLLTLAQAEPGGRPPSSEPVDLVAAARRALEFLVGLALERDMDLGFDPQGPQRHGQRRSDDAAGARGQSRRQRFALHPRRRRGHPRHRPGRRRLAATVQDSGPGIAEAERERVFERFYRTLGSGSEGSGLGLAIAKEIVDGAGGRISLTEAPGGRRTSGHGAPACRCALGPVAGVGIATAIA